MGGSTDSRGVSGGTLYGRLPLFGEGQESESEEQDRDFHGMKTGL